MLVFAPWICSITDNWCQSYLNVWMLNVFQVCMKEYALLYNEVFMCPSLTLFYFLFFLYLRHRETGRQRMLFSAQRNGCDCLCYGNRSYMRTSSLVSNIWSRKLSKIALWGSFLLYMHFVQCGDFLTFVYITSTLILLPAVLWMTSHDVYSSKVMTFVDICCVLSYNIFSAITPFWWWHVFLRIRFYIPIFSRFDCISIDRTSCTRSMLLKIAWTAFVLFRYMTLWRVWTSWLPQRVTKA